jgi:hypothetical protein
MQGLKLGLVGKFPVPEEVDDLLVADLAGEFVDIVTGVDEDAFLTAHIAERGGVGDDTFETFGDDRHGSERLLGWK